MIEIKILYCLPCFILVSTGGKHFNVLALRRTAFVWSKNSSSPFKRNWHWYSSRIFRNGILKTISNWNIRNEKLNIYQTMFTCISDKCDDRVSGITRSILVHRSTSVSCLYLWFSSIHSNSGVHLRNKYLKKSFFLFGRKKFYLFCLEHQWQISTFEHSLHVVYCSHVLKFCLII